MKFISLFSGIEAASLALEPLGFECVAVSEIEKFPNAVIEHHWPTRRNLGDVTKITDQQLNELGPIDLIIFGSPCQSFSFAGQRAGMDDPRGNLALIGLGIVNRVKPRWVIFENVPGIHSSWSDEATNAATEESFAAIREARRIVGEQGIDLGADFGIGEFEEVDQSSDFDTFLSCLEKCGYSFSSRVFDCQYFGLGQRRERVFVVGHLGDWRHPAAVLFDTSSLSRNPPSRKTSRENLAPSLAARTRGGGGLGTDAECDGAVISDPIPINMQASIKNGTKSPNMVGVGNAGDPAFTVNASDRHAVGVPEICGTITQNYATHHGRQAGNNGGIAEGQMIPEIAAVIRSGSSNQSAHYKPSGLDENLIPELAETVRQHPRPGSWNSGLTIPEVAGAIVARNSKGQGNSNSMENGHVIPVAFSQHQDGAVRESSIVPTLSTNENASGRGNAKVMQKMRVRRLLPEEAEKLQGFPRGFTKIPWHGKPAEKCPDSPRYRAIGNSFPIPVISYIGKRILEVSKL